VGSIGNSALHARHATARAQETCLVKILGRRRSGSRATGQQNLKGFPSPPLTMSTGPLLWQSNCLGFTIPEPDAQRVLVSFGHDEAPCCVTRLVSHGSFDVVSSPL
jgi:hypothetical protein